MPKISKSASDYEKEIKALRAKQKKAEEAAYIALGKACEKLFKKETINTDDIEAFRKANFSK